MHPGHSQPETQEPETIPRNQVYFNLDRKSLIYLGANKATMTEQKPVAYAVWKPGTKGEDIVNWWLDQVREQEKARRQIPDRDHDPDLEQGSGAVDT
jgi:hypothetical protein